MNDLCAAIRAGVRVDTARQWLGIGQKRWQRWRQTHSEPYNTLRSRVAAARAHCQVRLQLNLAKRSPGAALRESRKAYDADIDGVSREYMQTGVNSMKKNLPTLLSRAVDERIATSDLAPLEALARDWRDSVIRDLGGREQVTTTKTTLITATLGTWILLSTVDAFLMEMLPTIGIVNRRRKEMRSIVEQRAKLADSLVRQLQAVGLEKTSPAVLSIEEAIRHAKARVAENGHGPIIQQDPEPDA